MTDPFDWVELAALGIMLFYFGVRFRRGAAEGISFLRGFALIAPAAWLAEDTAIHAYGFYAYDPRWHVMLDRMPLMVATIWPFVILSARELAARLWSRRPAIVAGGAAIVVFDATLMECVATSSGLWTWTEPGLFGVPLMGIWGWGCFAAACIWLLETLPARLRPALVILAPALTHALLIASWWGFFKWITRPIPDWTTTGATIVACLALSAAALRWRRRARVPLDEMVARMVAASLFFALIALHHRGNAPLIAFALAFAPPWFLLMSTETGAARSTPTGCTPPAGRPRSA
ncbi:MAG: hypothetical protein AMXMBFR64_33700 [Myxococcales bacterium]